MAPDSVEVQYNSTTECRSTHQLIQLLPNGKYPVLATQAAASTQVTVGMCTESNLNTSLNTRTIPINMRHCETASLMFWYIQSTKLSKPYANNTIRIMLYTSLGIGNTCSNMECWIRLHIRSAQLHKLTAVS